MRRQVRKVFGSIDGLSMAEGLPLRFDVKALCVSFVDDSIALVVLEAQHGEHNLVVRRPAGDELARLGTTCGTGIIDEVLDVSGEIRVIEVTRHGDFQARLDLDSLTLERIAEWRLSQGPNERRTAARSVRAAAGARDYVPRDLGRSRTLCGGVESESRAAVSSAPTVFYDRAMTPMGVSG